MNGFNIFDRYKTPEDWKKRALENQYSQQPKLKRWQFASAIGATAVVVLSMILLPFVGTNTVNHSAGNEGSSQYSSSETNVSQTESKSSTQKVCGNTESDIYRYMSANYDRVVYGTVVGADKNNSQLSVVVDTWSASLMNLDAPSKYKDKYLVEMAFTHSGKDYTGGEVNAMAAPIMDLDVGDKVILGFNTYYTNLTNNEVSREMPEEMSGGVTTENIDTYTSYDVRDSLEGFANIGTTDDTEFLEIAESAKAVSGADDLNDSECQELIYNTYRYSQWLCDPSVEILGYDDLENEAENYRVSAMHVLTEYYYDSENPNVQSQLNYIFKLTHLDYSDIGDVTLNQNNDSYEINFTENDSSVSFYVDIGGDKNLKITDCKTFTKKGDSKAIYLMITARPNSEDGYISQTTADFVFSLDGAEDTDNVIVSYDYGSIEIIDDYENTNENFPYAVMVSNFYYDQYSDNYTFELNIVPTDESNTVFADASYACDTITDSKDIYGFYTEDMDKEFFFGISSDTGEIVRFESEKLESSLYKNAVKLKITVSMDRDNPITLRFDEKDKSDCEGISLEDLNGAYFTYR